MVPTEAQVTRPAPEALRRPRAPQLAAGVTLIGEFERSGYRKPPCLVRRADGQTLTLTPLLYVVVRALRDQADLETVAARVSSSYGRRLTASDVLLLAESKLRPLGLLKQPDGSDPEPRRPNPLLALTCRVVVSDPRRTRLLSAPWAWLFRAPLAVLVVASFALVSAWLYLDKGLSTAAYQAFYEPETLLVVWGAIILSAGFHELGHAAACRYGGATPGVMGAGLYLVWPAFYTDVTDSYRLGRRARLRVDLGGMYFNAVFGIAVFAAWWVYRVDALLLVLLAQQLQMVRQLAPFIRADGYHIIADIIGVPDLFAHIKPTLLSVVPRRWGGRPHPVLKTWARVVVTVWVVTVVPVLIALLALAVHILPTLAATAWDSMGVQGERTVDSWGHGDVAAAAVSVVYIVVAATPVLAIAMLLTRIAHRTSRRVWRATTERPRERVLAAVAGVAVLATVAWSWWPNGQYVPLEEPEPAATQWVSPAAPIAARMAPPAGPTSSTSADPSASLRAPGPAENHVLSSDVSLAAVSGHAPGEFYVVESLPGPQDGWPEFGIIDPPGDEPAWVFPFPPPPPPGDEDNQALAVNTTDGTLATAMSVMWAVVDDSWVGQQNEAHAYASCHECAAVAVAYQLLLITGSPYVITPVNIAAAANYECVECYTAALAVQLVVSVTDLPSAQAQALIDEALQELAEIEAPLGTLSVEDVYAALITTNEEIMQILLEDGIAPQALVDAVQSGAATPLPAPGVSGTASPAPVSPTDTATSTPSAESTTAPATTESPSPTAPAEPSGSGTEPTEPAPTADPSATAEPTPTDSTPTDSTPTEPTPTEPTPTPASPTTEATP